MKKTLALVLAVLMAFALFGCASTSTPTATTAPTTAAAATTAPAAGSAAASTAAAAAKDSSKQATLVYLCNSMQVAWCTNMANTMKVFQTPYNFKLIAGDSGNDGEKFVQLVQTYCDQKVDGFIFNPNPDLAQRLSDICNKAKIPFLFESSIMADANNKQLTAGAELDAYNNGALCGKWTADNYKTVGFSSVDPKNVGLITITNSTFVSFVNRATGAMDAYKKGFAGAQTFPLDVVSEANPFTAEAGYNKVAATIAAHPEVQLWCICGVLADWSQGAARAVEAAGLDKKAIVTSVGSEILPTNWDQNYSGCWMACDYFTEMDFVSQLIPALCSVVRGEKTVADLFPKTKDAGATYGDLKIIGKMATKDTYKAIRDANNDNTIPKA